MSEEKKETESNQDKGFGTVQARLLSAEFSITNKETKEVTNASEE